MGKEVDNSEDEFDFFENAAREAEMEELDGEDMEDVTLGHFVLIKDSVVDEAEILEYSDEHYSLFDKLEEIIKQENEERQKENDRPSSLMERKHPDYRVYWSMLEEKEMKSEKELIRFGDGRISYRIEEL